MKSLDRLKKMYKTEVDLDGIPDDIEPVDLVNQILMVELITSLHNIETSLEKINRSIGEL